MKYINENGEEFSITIEDTKWTVRFGPVWKVFKTFHVTTDEHAREVFWIISKLKNCKGCKRVLLSHDHVHAVCEPCRALSLSREPPTQPIKQCCVCYQELFEVLDNKVRLKCGHHVCKQCCSKLVQATGDFTWDLVLGIMYLSQVKCPMCRDVSVVRSFDFMLVPGPYNATIA